MPQSTGPALSYPSTAFPGNTPNPTGIAGEQLMSQLAARYSTMVASNKVFFAYSGTVTAPVIYSTAAGTGGPLIWNPPSSGVNAHLLAVGFSTSVVTTVAGGLGITGAGGQAVAPTSTTAIVASGSCKVGGAAPTCTPYKIGTPANAGTMFIPFAQVHTGALTVDNTGVCWVDLGGLVVVPESSWASVAGHATLSTLQAQFTLIWAELPA